MSPLRPFLRLSGLGFALTMALAVPTVASTATRGGGAPAPLLAGLAGIPASSAGLPFVANLGQDDMRVAFATAAFAAATSGGRLFITHDGEIVQVLPATETSAAAGRPGPTAGVVLRESLVGADVGPLHGDEPAMTRLSVFRGKNPAHWHSGLPAFGRVEFGTVYPGIGFHLEARGGNVERVFVVQPGACVDTIQVRVAGALTLDIDPTGQLVVETEYGPVTFTEPVAFQEVDGRRRPVSVAYTVHGDVYGFEVSGHDPQRALVIDPLLAATYLGGRDGDHVGVVTSDDEGNLYVAGHTGSTDFPTTSGAFQEYHGGTSDVFVAKLSGDLSQVLAATFLGGVQRDSANAVVIDTDGSVVVGGVTASPDFPTTAGAYDQTCQAGPLGNDAFVARLSGDLTTLIAASCLGGNEQDSITAVALDPTGPVFVAGWTESANFPTTEGAHDRTLDGSNDAFVAEFSGDLSTLLASTYYGGQANDWNFAMVRSQAGVIYVGGCTTSPSLPGVPGGYDPTFDGFMDGFVARFDSDLTTLRVATFLGGNDSGAAFEQVNGLCLDDSGNVVAVGVTCADDFPTTEQAFDRTYAGGSGFFGDAFVSFLDPDLAQLRASTLLGGDSDDAAFYVAPDTGGDLVVVGWTGFASEEPFPTTGGAFQENHAGIDDVFVTRFDSGLTSLSASTLVGGPSADRAFEGNIATLLADDSVVVVGETFSDGFPTTPGAWSEQYLGGTSDVFVLRLDRRMRAGAYRHHGDVNHDGLITVEDAQLGFLIALGAYSPAPFVTAAVDCNADGRVTAADAQQIFAIALQGGHCVDLP